MSFFFITNFCRLLNTQKRRTSTTIRNLWGYLGIAFNRVDSERLLEVGPNRLCAEWIIKNGGAVRFTENPTKLWSDYNSLPPEAVLFSIKVVDATDASIMKIGFDHFIGCTNIDTVILHNCKYLECDGLLGLLHRKDSLLWLQVSGCYNIDAKGMWPIGQLKNLERLSVYDMAYVEDLDKVLSELQAKLPNCKIQSTPLT